MDVLERLTEDLSPWRGRCIAVAMSGGIDSSLAAALLQRAGANVVGLHMRLWRDAAVQSTDDDARRVADRLGFPFHVVDLSDAFRSLIVEPFMKEYLAGRTPNPCVVCNRRIKFGLLLDEALQISAEALATGHYVRVVRAAPVVGSAPSPVRQPGATVPQEWTERYELLCGVDGEKDQSYFLSGLTQDQLARLVTPLGSIAKTQTRTLARQLDLHVVERPESVEICFITDNDYRRFVNEEAELKVMDLAGPIVDVHGEKIGHHEGIHNFTIGQRRGIGIAAPHPLYVIDLLPETRTVVVGYREETFADALEASDFNWVSQAPEAEAFRARVKIRYRSPARPATVEPDPADPSRVKIRFDEPVSAITPGQAVVAYDNESAQRVLGGGWINRHDPC